MFSGGEKNFVLNSVIGSSSNPALAPLEIFAFFYHIITWLQYF